LTEIATTEKKQISEKIFPVCRDQIAYKYSKIGKAAGSTNKEIKALLFTGLPKKHL
jgi:hypothetical protein